MTKSAVHGLAAVGNPPLAGDGPSDAAERLHLRRAQLEAPGRDLRHEPVLAAMERIPRHSFLPTQLRPLAYADRPLPIGFGQTISQPYLVAFMTSALDPEPGHRILEVGTGSGYQAAILSCLVREIYSIEIVEPLALRAREILSQLGCRNVQIKIGDGYQGWPEAAPFDAIIVTCAPDHLPKPLAGQLKEGGRMILPIGPAGEQTLRLVKKINGQIQIKTCLPVRFVPMTGEAQNLSPANKPNL
jgi:protein-L-isoaspartate(D-aspartate) O-methyltransferase